MTYTAKVSTGESSFSGPVAFDLNEAGTEVAPCGSGSQPFSSKTHSATCVLDWSAAGSYTLYASWPGDSVEPFSITSMPVEVGNASISAALTSTTSKAVEAKSIALSTTVVAAAGGAATQARTA